MYFLFVSGQLGQHLEAAGVGMVSEAAPEPNIASEPEPTITPEPPPDPDPEPRQE